MLSELSILAKERLLHIFNLSWSTCRVPREWKRATVIPIQKPNKPSNKTNSYRPISLTSLPCKLMERMILHRLSFYLDHNNLLSSTQAAYRKNHSTTDQVFFFTQNVHDGFQAKPTKSTVAAFLDMSSAFDRVWKQKLMLSLSDLGIEGKMFCWIHSFLKDRFIQVDYNNTYSNCTKLHQGIPQGSILSPLLFSIYLNNIACILSKDTQIALFADDIIIWATHRNTQTATSSLQSSLNKFFEFASSKKLSVNPNKSEVCVFTINNHLRSWRPTLEINSVPIPFNAYPKYLGVTLDPYLSYRFHIDNIVSRAKKRLNVMKYISGKAWGADANTLRITYLSLVRPLLEYALPVWVTASKTHLDRVDRIQASAFRIICGLRNTTPNDISSFEADLLPLHLRRNITFSRYILKSRSAPEGHRTGEYVRNWQPLNRLKRISPMHLICNNPLFSHTVQRLAAAPIAPHMPRNTPIVDLSLSTVCSKKTDISAHLKNLALQKISLLNQDSTFIFTDGSLLDDGHSGSGILVIDDKVRREISIKNPHGLSVYKSELNAINIAITQLDKAVPRECHIFSDSQAALCALTNCFSSNDFHLKTIAQNLNDLHQESQIFLHWIPSHVGIPGNEKADYLAKKGAKDSGPPSYDPISYEDVISQFKRSLYNSWKNSVHHHWYCSSAPGETLKLNIPRNEMTLISRMKSGHTKPILFNNGQKVFPVCIKCNQEDATPAHLLSCVNLTKTDLYKNPYKILQAFKTYNLHDLA